MKSKMLVATVAAFVLGSSSAQAFVWHLPMARAKAENIRLSREICEADSECISWAGNRCERITESRVDCLSGAWYPGEVEGEKIQCDTVMHWGVNRRGEVVLKRHGSPHCFVES